MYRQFLFFPFDFFTGPFQGLLEELEFLRSRLDSEFLRQRAPALCFVFLIELYHDVERLAGEMSERRGTRLPATGPAKGSVLLGTAYFKTDGRTWKTGYYAPAAALPDPAVPGLTILTTTKESRMMAAETSAAIHTAREDAAST